MKRITKFLMALVLCAALIVPVLSITDTAQAATMVKISKTSIILPKGKSYTLKITGTKKKAKWSTSKKSVATVSSKGKVTAKKSGTATITAKISNKKYRCKVKVMSENAIREKLNEAYNWQCGDIWNDGYCNIYHYIEDGKDALGNKMDINKTVSSVKKSLKQKTKWNNFVNSVQGSKYSKYKSTWNKLYKEMVKLEKCLNNGTPKAKSDYYFPYEKYSDYLWDLCGVSMSL